jgi:ABC-type Mn2+/Zn2+ transport system ATPase subunit
VKLQKYNDRIHNLSINIAQKNGIKDRIDVQCTNLQTLISDTQSDIKNKKEAHLLTLAFISQRRETAIKSIEDMGSYALRAIYGDDYKLYFLRNEEKKNSAAFKMEVGIESNFKSKKLITGLTGERGGGVVETASFALRIAALEWLGYKGPLLLDEAYKSMSNDSKIDKVAQFLKKYSETSGRQIIFATHKADTFSGYADNIVNISKINGISTASIL